MSPNPTTWRDRGDVVVVAWRASGSPTPAGAMRQGVCARCGLDTLVTSTAGVVSDTFTGFDAWAHPGGPTMCAACAFAYTPRLRSSAHQITRDPGVLEALSRTEAGCVLSGGSLSPDVAVLVPLRAGRKHLLPDARWGCVRVDDATLGWSHQDAARLRSVARLVAAGFPRGCLAEPAPPHRFLSRIPRQDWAGIFVAWDLISRWRTPASPWLALAGHLATERTQ